MLLSPPNTAASSVIDVEIAAKGSLKWRARWLRKYATHPCAPCTNGMEPSKPEAQNTAPSGWQALAGLILMFSRLKLSSLYSSVLVHSEISCTFSAGQQFSNSFLRSNCSL